MRPDDGWLIFALGVTLGFVAGWIGHVLYVALADAARYLVTAGRKLYGWHRARDAERLNRLEARLLEIYPDIR